jgi:autotransporter-associated beta strand protein
MLFLPTLGLQYFRGGKIMKRIACFTLIFGAVALVASTVFAASINVDFGPNDNTSSGVYLGTAAAADTGAYWNALQPGASYPALTETTFTSEFLLDSIGNTTGITVTLMPSFYLYDEGLAQSETNSIIAPELMHDYIFTPTAGGSSSYTFSIDGLDIGKSYDVFLYSDTGIQRTDFNIGGVVKKVTNPGSAQSSWGLGSNYQVFSDVSAAGGSIMVTVSGSAGPYYGVTNGFQIVESSGPISWTPATGNDQFEVATNWTPNAATDRNFFINGTVPAQLAVESPFTPLNLTVASTSDGQLNINTGGRLSVADTLSLSPNSNKATLNLSGDARLTVGQLQANGVVYGNGKTSIELNGTSQLTVNAATTYLSGFGQTCLTLKDQSTMSVALTGYFGIGEDNGVGTPAQSNGTGIVTVRDNATLTLGNTTIGNSGTAGAMRVHGGTVNMIGTGDVKHFGMWDGGYGLLEVTGGTVNAAPDSTYLVSLCIGSRGGMYGELYPFEPKYYCMPAPRGILSVSGTGIVDSSNGLITVNPGSSINIGTVGSASGTLLASGIVPMELLVGGDVNFHGGIFKAGNPILPEDPMYKDVIVASTNVNVYSEGAVVDSNSRTVNMIAALNAPAGNGILSLPVMAGGSGYTIAPIVKITSYNMGIGATAVAVLDGSGHVDHIQITNPGTNFVNGDYVLVELLGGDGSGAYSSSVTLVDSATDPVNFNIAANVSGGLKKVGAGSLILAASNSTYTGATIVNGGEISLAALANGGLDSPIGKSASDPANLVLDGGALRYTGIDPVTTDRGFTVGPAGAAIIADGNLTFSGNIVQSETGCGLVKKGAGTLTLVGNLTYTGPTDIQGGTVELIYSTAPLDLPGGITSSTGTGSLTVYDGVTLTTPSIVLDTLTIGGSVPTVNVVPEPSVLFLLLIAATSASLAVVRRK